MTIKMLNPSFTRGEFWLLNAVIDFSLEVYLLATDDIQGLLNRHHHNLPLNQLIQDILSLYNQGLIEVFIYTDDETIKPVKLNKNLIEQIFANLPTEFPVSTPQIYYQLSAKGGEYWESFTCPDWQYFVFNEEETINWDDWMTGAKAINRVEMACQNKEVLEGFLHEFCRGNINQSTVQWSKSDEFNVLYWKKLTNVHLLTFEYEENDDEFVGQKQRMKESIVGHSQMVNSKLWCEWY